MILTESMVVLALLIVGARFEALWRIWGLIREAASKGKRPRPTWRRISCMSPRPASRRRVTARRLIK